MEKGTTGISHAGIGMPIDSKLRSGDRGTGAARTSRQSNNGSQGYLRNLSK